jgi:hypothetical protein
MRKGIGGRGNKVKSEDSLALLTLVYCIARHLYLSLDAIHGQEFVWIIEDLTSRHLRHQAVIILPMYLSSVQLYRLVMI